MRILASVAVVVLVAGAALPSAEAQQDKKKAKKLLTEGDALFGKGEYEAALARYERAYQAFPSAKIFFPMAQAEEALGRDLAALEHYQRLIDEAGEDLSEDLRTTAAARIVEIQGRIVVITFKVKPDGATVTVDDVELGQAPLPEPVRFMPGTHNVVVSMEGFLPYERTIEASAGDQINERVILRRVGEVDEADREPAPVEQPPVEVESPGDGRTVFYAGLAGTGALAVGAVVTGVLALSKHGVYSDTGLSIPEREAAQSSGRQMALVTDGLLVGSVAVGAFTTWWYYAKVKPARQARERRPLDASVTPWVGGEGAGVFVTGRF